MRSCHIIKGCKAAGKTYCDTVFVGMLEGFYGVVQNNIPRPLMGWPKQRVIIVVGTYAPQGTLQATQSMRIDQRG